MAKIILDDNSILNLLKFERDQLKEQLKLNKIEFFASLDLYLENHVNEKVDIAVYCLYSDIPSLEDFIFTRLNEEDYASVCKEFIKNNKNLKNTYYLDKIISQMKKNEINYMPIVDGLNFSSDLPLEIFISFIKGMDFEDIYNYFTDKMFLTRLYSNSFSVQEKTDITSIILKKTYDSDRPVKYKNKIIEEIVSNASYVDKNFKNLILFENPTALTFDIIYLNFKSSLNSLSDELMHILIKSLNPLRSYELKSFLDLISNRDKILLKDALNLYKNERPSDRVFEELINYYLEKKDDKLKQILKDFFISMGNIPVNLASVIDKECMRKASLSNIPSTYLSEFNEKNVDFLSSENNKENEEVLKVLKEKIDNNEKVNSILFIKFAKEYLSKEEITKYLDKDNVIFNGFNKYMLSSDNTIKYVCKEKTYTNFITKKIMPHITLSKINELTDGIISAFTPMFLNEILNIVNNELDENNKLGFSFIQILNITDDLDLESKNKLYTFFNGVVDKNLLNFEEAFSRKALDQLKLKNNDLTNKILYKLIDIYKEYVLDLLTITELLSKNNIKIEKQLSKVIENLDDFENTDFNDLFPKSFENHNIYLNSIIKAIESRRIIIPKYFSLTPSFLNTPLLNCIYNVSKKSFEHFLNYISNNYYEIKPYLTEEFNINFINLYSNYFGFDKDVLLFVYKNYSDTFFPLLLNDDFKYLCMKNIKQIDKVFNLVKIRTLDIPTIEAINWSIREGIFAKKNQDILTIYQKIISDIQNEDIQIVKERHINTLKRYVPKSIKSEVKKTENDLLYNLYLNKNYTLFLDYLFDLIKHDQEKYSDILNLITKNYIISKRNEYGSEGNIYNDTDVLFEFNEKSLQDFLFNGLVLKNKDLLLKIIYTDNKTKETDEYVINLLRKNDENSKTQLADYGKHIGNMRKRFYKFYNSSVPQLKEIFKNFDELEILENVKKKIVIESRKKSLEEVFERVNIKNLFDIVNDDEIYSALLDVMKKYKILDWSNIFDKQMENLLISSSNENMGMFLSCFKSIYSEEKNYIDSYVKPFVLREIKKMKSDNASEEKIESYKKDVLSIKYTPLKILRLITEYSNIPMCYKVLLGEDDFNLVRTDPEPNSAEAPEGYAKFDRCIEVLLKSFKQRYVSIPSFTTLLTLDNGKKVKVIVGNRTHPRNLTHGERTGSCMRAYGYADKKKEDDLFEFCASNINGFHITLLDEFDNYITRASGYRLENTVVLNQVRNSTKENFDDEDIIEAFKKLSKIICEKSTDSIAPIDNVVTSARMAFKGYRVEKLTDGNIGGDVYKGHKDVANKVAVIYTKGSKLATLNGVDTSEIKYECTRLEPILYEKNIGDKEKILMQRITAIKKCLENDDDKEFYKQIDLNLKMFNTNYKYLILGDDFYVAVSYDNEIEYDYIPLDDRCIKEMDEALEKAKNYIGETYERRK